MVPTASFAEEVPGSKVATTEKQTQPTTSDDLQQRGKKLRTSIEDLYHMLVRKHGLLARNDISDLVELYIPSGTSFADAETILRSAGFAFGIPKLNSPAPSLHAYMRLESAYFTKVEVGVDVLPDLPEDNRADVGSVAALIYYSSL